jgi:hypothetical protein
MNQREPAADAYRRALDLCGNRAEKSYLRRRLHEMLDFSLRKLSKSILENSNEPFGGIVS